MDLRTKLTQRCRRITQRIIEAIGSNGPEDAEQAVDRVLAQLAAANAQRDELLRLVERWQAADEAASSAWENYQDALRTNGGMDPEPELASVARRSNILAAAALEALRCFRVQSGQPACNGPVGINGQRDPDHPCDMFRYGKPSERNTCEGDGHYLCNECGHYRCDPPEQSGQPAQRDDDLSKHDDHCNCERCR